MTEERSTHTEEQEKKPRPWRPTNRQALWAIGLVVALVTLTLLVADLYPDIWQYLSRERVAMPIGIGVALVAVIVLLAIGGASLGWTGFADKTLWEWLQLLGALAIPLVLAIAGFWFTSQQETRQQRIEDQRAQQAQKIENQRAEAEQEIEEQRAQDAALQAYLDQMSTLLLERSLRNSKEDSEARTLARARTATVIQRLDADGNRNVIRFLDEAGLTKEGQSSIRLLAGVDLQGAQLGGIDLAGTDLSDAYLSDAYLSDAYLPDANLRGADLRKTYLRGAALGNADLSSAWLNGANLYEANLSRTDLSNADMRETYLWDANLILASLSGANLRGAYLSEALLLDAEGVTEEKLEQQTFGDSLEAAAMPDGTIYPGLYVANEFELTVSFEVDEGWEFWAPETPEEVFIHTGPKGGQLIFTNPRHVFDPAYLSQLKKLPAPESAEEWVSWLQNHPNLDTSKLRPVSVGGASGKRIDMTASSMPENYPKDFCGEEPCVPLYPLSDVYVNENGILGFEGYKDRFVIVAVGGETVLIDVSARVEKFDEFLPKAQKVLDSVEWKGG